MGKNRDRLSIIAAILETVSNNGGIGKTRIMYQSNLSFALLEKYLNAVLKLGFIQTDGNVYRLTDHGRRFLDRYNLFYSQFLRVQQLLEAVSSERERLSSQIAKPLLVPIPSKMSGSEEA